MIRPGFLSPDFAKLQVILWEFTHFDDITAGEPPTKIPHDNGFSYMGFPGFDSWDRMIMEKQVDGRAWNISGQYR